jgi:hypothetical protein
VNIERQDKDPKITSRYRMVGKNLTKDPGTLAAHNSPSIA